MEHLKTLYLKTVIDVYKTDWKCKYPAKFNVLRNNHCRFLVGKNNSVYLCNIYAYKLMNKTEQ